MQLLAQTERVNNRAQQPEALFRLQRHVDAERVSASPAGIDRRDTPFRKTVVAGGPAAAATATQSKAAEEIEANSSSSTREDTYGEAEAMAADERRSPPPRPCVRDARSVSYHRYHRRRVRQGHAFSSEQSSFGEWREESSSRDTSCGWRPRQHTEGRRAAASGSFFIDGNYSGSSSPTAPAYEPSPLTKASATEKMSGPNVLEARPKELFGSSGVEETKQEQRRRMDATAALAKVDSLTHGGGKAFGSRVAGLPSPHHQEVHEKPRTDQDHFSRQQPPQPQVPVVSSLEGEKPPSPTIDREGFPSTTKRSGNNYESVREDLLRYMEGVRAR